MWWIAIVAFVVFLVLVGYRIAVELIAKYDLMGLFPRNDIRRLNKEDGGSGPI